MGPRCSGLSARENVYSTGTRTKARQRYYDESGLVEIHRQNENEKGRKYPPKFWETELRTQLSDNGTDMERDKSLDESN